MEQFLDWLDASLVWVTLAHKWPWLLVTAALAVVTLIGVFTIARRYDDEREPLGDPH
ncbi:MAG: hypothetical protein ABJB01_04880 [Rudaea sp.]